MRLWAKRQPLIGIPMRQFSHFEFIETGDFVYAHVGTDRLESLNRVARDGWELVSTHIMDATPVEGLRSAYRITLWKRAVYQ